MPAVQRAHRPVHGDVQSDVAAVAEENQRTPALVDRPVGGNEQVRAQQILVQFQCPLQVWRARFFFALENHFEIHRQGNGFRPQRVQGRQQRYDRRLVVGSRPRVNPPIVVISGPSTGAVARERDAFSSRLDCGAAQHRLERCAIGPCRGIDGLPVVMRVENDRALRLGRNQFSEHHWPASGNRQQVRFDSSRFQHLHKMRGIFLDV